MAYSLDLYQLIQTLTPNEKRYFRLQASAYQPSDTQYMLLFEAIVEQVTAGNYDEAALREQFKAAPFARQFHVAKHYLYTLLCKALVKYEAANNKEARIAELLQTAQLLLQRRLNEGALKATKKAMKLAAESHLYAEMAKAAEIQEKIYGRMLDFEAADQANDKQCEIIAQLEQTRYNRQFGVKLYKHYLRSTMGRSSRVMESLSAAVDVKALTAADEELNVMARIHKYNARIIYESLSGNAAGQVEYQQRIAALYENSPTLIKDNPRAYIIALLNLAQIQFEREEPEEALALTAKIKSALKLYKVKPTSETYIDTTETILEIEFLIHIQSGDSDASERTLVNMDAFLRQYDHTLNNQNKINLLYSLGLGYFYLDAPRKALSYFNALFADRYKNIREDLQYIAELCFMATHVELDNDEVVASLERSHTRKLKQQEEVNRYERAFLQMIRTWLRHPENEKREQAFSAFLQETQGLEANPKEAQLLEYFDMIAWIKAKMQHKPILEIKSMNQNKV